MDSFSKNDPSTIVQDRTVDLLESNKTLENEIAARRAAQAALEVSEQRYRNILTTSNEAIFTTDRSFNIVFANQVALDLFQGTEDQIVGQSALSFVHEEDRPQMQQRLRNRQIGKYELCECRIRRLGGRFAG
jgi:PAS domain-containing protein